MVMLRADRNPYEGRDTLREWLDDEVEVITAPRRWPLIPLYFIVRRLLPEIIHTHHRRDSRYLAMVKPRNVPVVATLHMPFRAKDYQRHDGLICVSPWQLADVPIRKDRKRVVIPNWVMPAPEVTSVMREALREQAGIIPPFSHMIGVVGRLTAEKGTEDLLDAFLQLRPAGVKLCIFGEGECRPAIEEKIAAAKAQEHVQLMGYEPNIRKWYAAFDGFILPSRYETFGLVLLEAMSMKLPILATRTRGALDVLGNDTNVIWAQANDPADMKTALEKFIPLLDRKYEYPELEKYQPEQAFNRVMEFYSKVAHV